MKRLNDEALSILSQVCVLLLVFICSSCASFTVTPRPLPPLVEPHAYVQSIINKKPPAFFSATARIKTQSPQGKLSARAAVFARAASSLRVELYGFANQLVLLFTTNGTELNIFYPYSGSFYTGSVADQGLSLLFGGEITSIDAVDLLCGLPPVIPFTEVRVINSQESPCYQCELISEAKQRQQIWIDPGSRKVVKYILYSKTGNPLREFKFSDFKLIENFMVPFKIDLIFYDNGTQLAINYQEVNMPRDIEDQLFSMIPPAGAKIQSLKDVPHSNIVRPPQ